MWVQGELDTGRAWGKKFFVRVCECWPVTRKNNMRKKFNAIYSLWYNGVVTISRGGESTDWNFQLYLMAPSAASEQVSNMAGHVVNRSVNLKNSSMNNILFFNSSLKAKKEGWLTGFTALCCSVFKSSCCLWNKPLNKLSLVMKHIARVFSGFQTQIDRYRFGTETVQGRHRLGGHAEQEQARFFKFLQGRFKFCGFGSGKK